MCGECCSLVHFRGHLQSAKLLFVRSYFDSSQITEHVIESVYYLDEQLPQYEAIRRLDIVDIVRSRYDLSCRFSSGPSSAQDDLHLLHNWFILRKLMERYNGFSTRTAVEIKPYMDECDEQSQPNSL